MQAAPYQQAAGPANDVVMSDSTAQSGGTTASAMDVDQQPATQSLKRKAEEPLGADDAKKTKSDVPLKRCVQNMSM